jgi:hypothetical protein
MLTTDHFLFRRRKKQGEKKRGKMCQKEGGRLGLHFKLLHLLQTQKTLIFKQRYYCFIHIHTPTCIILGFQRIKG